MYNGLNMTTGRMQVMPPGVLPKMLPIPRPQKGMKHYQDYRGQMIGQQGYRAAQMQILPPGWGQPVYSRYYRY